IISILSLQNNKNKVHRSTDRSKKKTAKKRHNTGYEKYLEDLYEESTKMSQCKINL
ncbi:hypothetical protein L9F63_004934, partial [Diploptera punctata]